MFKQSLLLSTGAKQTQLEVDARNYAEAHSHLPQNEGFTVLEVAAARAAKMTGPRATPPTWRAVRKTILRMRNGMATRGSWRSWPSKTAKGVA